MFYKKNKKIERDNVLIIYFHKHYFDFDLNL